METGNGPMTRGDFAYGEEDMDLEIADAAGIVESYYDWQVPSTSRRETATNVQTELVDSLAVCRNNNNFVCCSQECGCELSTEWMLDSGASLHFTGDINDFVEFSPMENGISVMTANSSAVITGNSCSDHIKRKMYGKEDKN